MKIITTDIKEANEILKLKYSLFEVTRFGLAFGGRLVAHLLLEDANDQFDPAIDERVFIVFLRCDHLSGRFRFKNPKLNMTTRVNEHNETILITKDLNKRFKLISGSDIIIYKGTFNDFEDENLYKNFIEEW